MMPSCTTTGPPGNPGSFSPGARWLKAPCWCVQGQSWVSREPYWGVSRHGPVLALSLANWVRVALHLGLAAWVPHLLNRGEGVT